MYFPSTAKQLLSEMSCQTYCFIGESLKIPFVICMAFRMTPAFRNSKSRSLKCYSLKPCKSDLGDPITTGQLRWVAIYSWVTTTRMHFMCDQWWSDLKRRVSEFCGSNMLSKQFWPCLHLSHCPLVNGSAKMYLKTRCKRDLNRVYSSVSILFHSHSKDQGACTVWFFQSSLLSDVLQTGISSQVECLRLERQGQDPSPLLLMSRAVMEP